MTTTAVVILNYNGEKLLRQFLPSVIAYSPEAQVIVADNGSNDDSLHTLVHDFPSVRVIRLDKNYGFCGGYNRALAEVSTDYYVLLNSDIEVTAGWLQPLIRRLDSDLAIQAIQPKILSYRDKDKFEYAGAAGGFIDVLGYSFCRGRVFDHVETDHGQYDDEREVFWATGACLMIRSAAYRKFGGLDEDLFAHMEEIDLCWKIVRSGGKVYYSGKSKVYHVGAGTLGHENPRKTYLNFRNNMIMTYKHWDTAELWYKLPVRFVLDWIAAAVFVLKGMFSHGRAVMKAHRHFLWSLPKNKVKRRQLHLDNPSYSRNNIHPGMILFDYYLRRKKTGEFNNPR